MSESIQKKLKRGRSCYSCFGCQNICPKKAISYEYDKEGLCFPVIDGEKCIVCGKCVEICHKQIGKEDWKDAKYYVGASQEQKILDASSSGGIFSELAIHILSQGGIVFGATFDADKVNIRHVGIEKEDNLSIIRKSKYVQSDCSNIYREIIFHAQRGRKTLFCGTPCQAAVLREMLGNERENVLIVDLFCHGVSSEKLFAEYINLLEGRVDKIDFRHEVESSDYYLKMEITDENDNSIQDIRKWGEDALCQLFVNSVSLKYSCMNCKYASYKHPGDITLGDFDDKVFAKNHGILYKNPSVIGINTKKGLEIWREISSRLSYKKIYNKELLKKYFRQHLSLKGPWGYDIQAWKSYRKKYVEKGFEEATLEWIYSEYARLLLYIKHNEKKTIYIYGAGVYGKRLLYLLSLFVPKRQISGFIVSKKEDSFDRINGIEIFTIDKILPSHDNLIILAVNEKNQKEIIEQLRETREDFFENKNLIEISGNIIV